ncbi:MAG: bifunctional diguanylate cyclase/phosphodiesterase [Deferrisomatales bacterium]|nr:bifunctional diguanylate cyclase/phosphodiesterase [Deferrisomatales bacterium]
MRTASGSACHVSWVYTPLLSMQEPTLLGVGIDLTSRKRMETRLSWLSDHDPLTGLANRARFSLELTVAIETAKRYRRTGAFLLLDLDHFRAYNQSVGHAAGDLLLTAVAQALRRAARSADLVARFGADEFGILLREVGAEEVAGVARKFGKILREELRLPASDGVTNRLSASMGLVIFPRNADTCDAAFTAANHALSAARARGHGTLHVYSENDGSTKLVQDDVYWRNRVEQALIYDRFVLHYQPILHLESNAVTHYEALVRMVEVDGSLVSPGQFIPPCEQTSLIHSLDYLVLEKAVSLMAALPAERQALRFSVNVSARTLEHEEFLGTVRQVLEDHGVAPERLILELTETSAIGNIAATRQVMQGLRALGCSLALDDFGVGFSSLVYLKELPVDYVKVDGTFVRELNENKGDQILVRSVRDIAHAYGTKLVAEFVESVELLEIVREYGVDYAQGYEIGRPVPAETLFPELPTRTEGRFRTV